MKKRGMILVMMIGIFGLANAQVGINTEAPAVTLDVVVNSSTSGNATIAEGVLIPRISLSILKIKDNAYGNNQNGTLVYVNDITGTTTAKTVNIKGEGFYYYDAKAGVWKTLETGSGSTINIMDNTENITNITINGKPIYSFKGSFNSDGIKTEYPLSNFPLGVTGIYKVTIYNTTYNLYTNTVYSLDATGTLITGSPSISVVYPSGTYNYIVEYLK
ncbi:hypothetical protein [Dysgonomonas macrotermitis]|uniref:Uncharacterized protein n=1 Tax=Dysgonomonas macrotermitis TaxID=1346286 RepID=A0A1M4WIC8_9BACT|nr:hypothetical protein [Dysgonomonas macrotermitis]SHE80813.1 hypothetical protein SAMN05444362_102230 [Dysgonomonas macrotermitis]